MRRRRVQILLTGACLLLLVLLGACAKNAILTSGEDHSTAPLATVDVPIEIPGTNRQTTVPEIVQKPKPPTSPSLPVSADDGFPRPLAEASPEIQALAPAVALVTNSGLWTGSGFFISKNGLFLTNEHVISARSCANRRCPGFKIIAGFYPGGQLRQFTDFEVLAQENDKYDFALIQVHLPPGATVPFLDLDMHEGTFANTETSLDTVLGHLGGASLHVTRVTTQQEQGVNGFYKGAIGPGNSGSPFIDLNAKKVIGLVKSIQKNPKSDVLSITPGTTGLATTLSSIANFVRSAIGSSLLDVDFFADTKKLNLSSGATPRADNGHLLSLLRIPQPAEKSSPEEKKSFSENLLTFVRLIGTDQERPALKLMFQKSSAYSGEINTNHFFTLMTLSFKIGRSLDFDDETFKELMSEFYSTSANHHFEYYALVIRLKYFDENARTQLQSQCLQEYHTKKENLAVPLTDCLVDEDGDGMKLLPRYEKWLREASGYQTIKDIARVDYVLMNATEVSPQTPENIQAILGIESFVARKSKDIMTVFHNDALTFGFSHHLLGLGSFHNAFPPKVQAESN